MNWCNIETSGCSLLNFNLEHGFDGVTGAGFSGYTMSFDKEAVVSLAANMRVCGSMYALQNRNKLWQSAEIYSAQRRLNALFSKVRSGDLTLMYEHQEFLSQELISLVIEEICYSARPGKVESPSYRETALKRSLEILRNPENLPFSVAELCCLVQASPATLHRAFRSRFNVSTKSYIRKRCLSAVRDELAISPPDIPVYKLANRWGFWHMSQFAKDFKEMFDYLPSDVTK